MANVAKPEAAQAGSNSREQKIVNVSKQKTNVGSIMPPGILNKQGV